MAIDSAILWLRRIVSCFSFTLAILFAALWVRSYWHQDDLRLPVSELTILRLDSMRARIVVYPFDTSDQRHLHELVWKHGVIVGGSNEWKYYDDLVIAWSWIYMGGAEPEAFVLPHWPLVLTSALLAIAIRPAPRFIFSLRDLFTLTTVAALTIGPLAFWLRSIG